MQEIITSTQNPRIKSLLKLIEKSSERRAQGLFVIEGARELGLAVAAGYVIETLFLCPELADEKFNFPAKNTIQIGVQVFNKLAYREQSDGVIALMMEGKLELDDIKLSSNPLILILEAVEKPGNLGAVLRTADAAGVDAVIVCDPRTDLFNPNVIRSSVGCLFTNQVVATDSESVRKWLETKGITYFASALSATKSYVDTDFTVPCAIVMGTEAVGLTEFWLNPASQQIKIPMNGKIDSLNVAACTAIITFEAVRQRLSAV